MNSSASTADIYRMAYIAAEAVDDSSLWTRLKKIHEALDLPDEWKGENPDQTEIWLKLPEGSVFVPSLSSRVGTPLGTVLRASYFIDLEAAEVVSYFEDLTGREAKREESLVSAELAEIVYSFALWPMPEEFGGFMEFGVTIFESSEGFEENVFGQTLKKGNILFRITNLVRR